MTGKAVQIPGLTMGTEASESVIEADAVRRILETITRIQAEFREAETKKKLQDCQGIRVRSYQNLGNYLEGDKVWYQYKDSNAWYGPASVINHKGNVVFIHANGEVRKVAVCNVKPYELIERNVEENKEDKEVKEVKDVENKENEETRDWNDWIEEGEKENEEQGQSENEESDREDLLKDAIGAHYLKMEQNVWFMEQDIFTVQVPVKDHGKREVIEAKEKEIENLELYGVFEEVDDIGQERIGSRWVVTEKQKHDRRKQQYKA